MEQMLETSQRVARRIALVCACMVLPACSTSTSQPVNSAAAPGKITATEEDNAMRPDRMLAGCTSFESAGNYVIAGTGVSFYVGRDKTSDSIRKVQELFSKCDFKLVEKGPHSEGVPLIAGALWMKIEREAGAPVSLRVYNGTTYIASDGVTDWQWRGPESKTYFDIVDAFAPNASERHEEPAKDDKFGGQPSQTAEASAEANSEPAIKSEAAKDAAASKPKRAPAGTQQFRRAFRP
jgi:hypothetical protein